MEFPNRCKLRPQTPQTGPFQCLPNECLPTEFNTALDYSEGFIEGQFQIHTRVRFTPQNATPESLSQAIAQL
jgi:hypothetical protein